MKAELLGFDHTEKNRSSSDKISKTDCDTALLLVELVETKLQCCRHYAVITIFDNNL